ncbi:hypothetical protein EAH79_11805 [Sphingomonas koreensis]|nr:hypothetical protein EAH79_11805 [Sphingomonas koreensis]
MDDPEQFGRLSPAERDLAMFLNEGGSIDSLSSGATAVTSTDEALTIPFNHDDGRVETVALDELLTLKNLKVPFAEVAAQRAEEVERHTLDIELGKLSRFVDFLASKRRTHVRLEEINNDLLRQFRDWLDEERTPPVEGTGQSTYAVRRRKGEQPLSVDYKRELYRTAVSYLGRLRLQSAYRDRMQPDLDLNTEGTWTKRSKRNAVPILTRDELKMLVCLCREEVVATTRRLRAYWAIQDGTATAEHLEIVDPDVAREVSAMAAFFGDDLSPPCHDKLRVVLRCAHDGSATAEFSKRTFPLLWAMNGPKYQDAVTLLYPTPARMLPFCLLFAVYYRYNTGVLVALKQSDLKRQASVFGERLQGSPFKNRAKRKQHASWPITTEAHNPAEMIEVLGRWTALIKNHAPKTEREHLFLFRSHNRDVNSFAVNNALRRHTSMFLKKYAKEMKGRQFTPRSIRPSVIDLVHHLFDGDVVMAAHAGQHRQVDTTIEHYLYDGARKRNDEGLAPVTAAMQRWVDTGGVIDPRRAGSSPTLAATPGWECKDLYAGHIAGEVPNLPCRAYGRCVSCELGTPRLDSPLAYALAVKLREAMRRARRTMPEHAWLDRWMPELDLLERIIALDFTDEAKAAANLDIPDLPTVE